MAQSLDEPSLELQKLNFEKEKLVFEERKWADEFLLRRLETEAKIREGTWISKLFSPLPATILAGVVTVAGSVIATFMQSKNALQLETTKFETTKSLEEQKFRGSKELETQKQQHELVLKMISVDSVEQAQKNLRFLADTKLIADEKLAERLRTVPAALIPPQAASLTLESAVSPDEFKRSISEDAIELIVSLEVDSRKYYEANLAHPQPARGTWGIMIGFGYDLGSVSVDQFQNQWSTYLPKNDLERLATAVGVRGDAASDLARRLADVTISWDAAYAVFVGKTLPVLAGRLNRALPNVRELPPDSYGALLALIVSRGVTFDRAGDRYQEMREIRSLFESKRFAEVPVKIRAMKRLWPNMKGLIERREREAKLFEKGLGSN